MKTNKNISEILGEKVSIYLDHICKKITKDELQTPGKNSLEKLATMAVVMIVGIKH